MLIVLGIGHIITVAFVSFRCVVVSRRYIGLSVRYITVVPLHFLIVVLSLCIFQILFILCFYLYLARCFVFPSFISELCDLAACGVLVSSFYTLKFELRFLVLDELCVKSWLRY